MLDARVLSYFTLNPCTFEISNRPKSFSCNVFTFIQHPLGSILSQQKHILAVRNSFCSDDTVTDQKNIRQSIYSIQKYFPEEYRSLSKLEELNQRRLEVFRYCENNDQQTNKQLIIVGTDENIDFAKDEIDITGALENGLNNLNPEELKEIGLRNNKEYQLFQLSFPYNYINTEWQSKIIDGIDKQGNRAILDIKTLGKGYFWHLGKVNFIDTPTSLIDTKQGLPMSRLDKVLSNHSFQTLLRVSDDIVSVGTASCEGDTSKEERIAFLRANELRNYVNENYMPPRTRLANNYALTIGQYQGNNCPQNNPQETAEQRFIMVIGVKQVNEGRAKQANLCDILSEALYRHEKNNKNPLSGTFKIEEYSEFTFGSPSDKGNSCKLKG